jgi:AcrR family transcriptional regulator
MRSVKLAESVRASLRADAELNRARIVEVARGAFTSSSDATMQSIAKAAGVGQGTLYRHFPSRESLLLAVYRQDVRALINAADPLLGQHAPLTALRRWFDHLAAYCRIKHATAQAIEAATRADLSNEYYDEVIAAITRLLDAGKSSGDVRADIDAEEVLLLTGFLWRMDGDDWEARSRRMLDLVMSALRT